ncbi:MAG: zinc ribbon domain-containing protein [Clostridia bacterium]|nr:zinc ribbon domain-containing protein [Clostridia bacterium]
MSPTEKLRYRNMEDFGFGPNVLKKTKVCAQCGKMVKANVRTCPECGERLSSETLFDRYKQRHKCCPDCDTVLAPGSRYCPNCGKQVLQKASGYEKGGG